jgi:hypothetical protein
LAIFGVSTNLTPPAEEVDPESAIDVAGAATRTAATAMRT